LLRSKMCEAQDRQFTHNSTLRYVRATIVAVSECVFVALGIQHPMRMPDIFMCGLHGSTIFFHAIL